MSSTNIELEIKHLATKEVLKFMVRVKRYEQNVKANFSSTQVYARMDPIFTYQNTTRNFLIDCHTLLPEQGSPYDETQLRGKISRLYKFMYPLYEVEKHDGGFSTTTLKGPPLLSLRAPRLLTSDKYEGVIFVPETFSLTTGLADSEKIQYVVGGPEDLRYLAPAGGYGFSLGGTILHKNSPPGFVLEEDADGGGSTIKFSKDSFPLGV